MTRAWNPILTRELKERMRHGLRVPVILTLFLSLLAVIVMTTERGLAENLRFDITRSASIGRGIFHWMLFFLLFFVCFMVPAFSAGAISSERERQTLHLVQVTMMRPRAIVAGKVAAAVSYLLVLILATAPLLSVSFLLGGVSGGQVIKAYASVMFVGVTIAIASIGLSAISRRTMTTTVLSYMLVLALTIGSLIGWALLRVASTDEFGSSENRLWTLVVNPFFGVASAISDGTPAGMSASPFDGIAQYLEESSNAPVQRIVFDENGEQRLDFQAPPRGGGPPVWASMGLWYLAIAGLGWFAALSGVRAPSHTFHVGRKRRRGEVEET